MKLTPTLGGAYSGSFGGLTASRNKGGQYLRRRAMPVNPNTEQQAAVRSSFGEAVNQWTSLLNDAQRTAWIEYAQLTPYTDKLGQPIQLSGQQMWVRTAAPYLYASSYGFLQSITLGGAPPTNELGPMYSVSTATIEIDDSPAAANLTVNVQQATEANAAYLVYLSPAVNPGITSWKGPYALVGGTTWTGQAITDSLLPTAISPWTLRFGPAEVGKRYAGYFRTLTEFGALSKPTYFGPIEAEAAA